METSNSLFTTRIVLFTFILMFGLVLRPSDATGITILAVAIIALIITFLIKPKLKLVTQVTLSDGTPVVVYKQQKRLTFAQMFHFIGSDLDKLCLTEEQRKFFCENHLNLFSEGTHILFLQKKEENKLVTFDNVSLIRVIVELSGFHVANDTFKFAGAWNVGYCHHIVVPKLAN